MSVDKKAAMKRIIELTHYQLTEAEIKSMDERYWPFAVPVEEVAER